MTAPLVVIDGSAPPWAQRLETDLNDAINGLAARINPPFLLKANLPTNGSIRLAIVTDEAGGSVLAFWEGAAWRRVTDRAVVS